jgi:molybdopterin synthase catalytic subunit
MVRTGDRWLEVTEDNLDVEAAYRFTLNPEAGAVDLFVGTVRNRFEKRPVASMEYHGYAEMAERVLQEIVHRATERWPIRKVAVLHRLGHLQLTEASVVIAVSAPHRAEAFESCRFILEELKKDLPVWKKEHFSDGTKSWKNLP